MRNAFKNVRYESSVEQLDAEFIDDLHEADISAEHRLLLAVLEVAVDDARGKGHGIDRLPSKLRLSYGSSIVLWWQSLPLFWA